MSFVNVKHWPTLPSHVFPKQYAALGLNEPDGLWFRAVGDAERGGTLVFEVWEDHLAWRRHREAEAADREVAAAKTAHDAHKPGASLRTEVTAQYFAGTNERSVWRSSVSPGGMLAVTYPDIPIQKYLSGLEKHGQTAKTSAGQGVLCAVDGPSGDADWTVARVWNEVSEHAEAIAKQIADLRKPEKSRACFVAELSHLYVTAACPEGSRNPLGEGRFL